MKAEIEQMPNLRRGTASPSKVFIAHHRADHEQAKLIKVALVSQGVNVIMYDPDSPWLEVVYTITEGIRTSHVLLIVGNYKSRSKWLQSEINYARSWKVMRLFQKNWSIGFTVSRTERAITCVKWLDKVRSATQKVFRFIPSFFVVGGWLAGGYWGGTWLSLYLSPLTGLVVAIVCVFLASFVNSGFDPSDDELTQKIKDYNSELKKVEKYFGEDLDNGNRRQSELISFQLTKMGAYPLVPDTDDGGCAIWITIIFLFIMSIILSLGSLLTYLILSFVR